MRTTWTIGLVVLFLSLVPVLGLQAQPPNEPEVTACPFDGQCPLGGPMRRGPGAGRGVAGECLWGLEGQGCGQMRRGLGGRWGAGGDCPLGLEGQGGQQMRRAAGAGYGRGRGAGGGMGRGVDN
jgi:hypothetical protein